ncbi:unnamed protein product [Cunninghamella blakesleeana]
MTTETKPTQATHDEDTASFFKELEKEEKKDYLTCSASQAFDSVWQCYTLGSQAIHYYRYGSRKDCSAKWEDFKFCLTTKTKSSEVADAMVRNRDAQKQLEKKKQRNSEEVWELRV